MKENTIFQKEMKKNEKQGSPLFPQMVVYMPK